MHILLSLQLLSLQDSVKASSRYIQLGQKYAYNKLKLNEEQYDNSAVFT